MSTNNLKLVFHIDLPKDFQKYLCKYLYPFMRIMQAWSKSIKQSGVMNLVCCWGVYLEAYPDNAIFVYESNILCQCICVFLLLIKEPFNYKLYGLYLELPNHCNFMRYVENIILIVFGMHGIISSIIIAPNIMVFLDQC